MIKTVQYLNGKKQKVLKPSCVNCSLLQIAPGDTYHNWCVEIPALCEFSISGNGGDETLPPPPDGGSSCESCYPILVENLAVTLNLNTGQKDWLSMNMNRAFEIDSYLKNTTESTANQIAVDHINQMMSNAVYLDFVIGHSATGDNTKIWWEDDNWLINPSNFCIQVEPLENGYKLTAAEKALIKKHPIAAAIIRQNVSVAMTETERHFPAAFGLNDKSDAFRHCFFNALNTVSVGVGSNLTRQFADAHETEVPPQLILEAQMDQFNNNIGILYGESVSFMISISNLSEGAYNRKEWGSLRYLYPINRNDSLFYGGGNPLLATHGITSTTELIPTNQ